MFRNDYDLAFMLKYENIAWYENGRVRILDRRSYPRKIEYVDCLTYQEVAKAIKDMVTQSEGPYICALMGMALAGKEYLESEVKEDIWDYLLRAQDVLTNARPTTHEQMKRITDEQLAKAKTRFLSENKPVDTILFEETVSYLNNNYERYDKIAKICCDRIKGCKGILTNCFPGTVIGLLMRNMKERNLHPKIYCLETRPYYQGSRLTASVCSDMGFDVTVITDNMLGFVMQNHYVDVAISASDVITLDGHIINKIGTSAMSIVGRFYDIPYYCTGTPDISHKDLSNVKIEFRDPTSIVCEGHEKIVLPSVKAIYPAFDITEPENCAGIITDKGIYRANEVYKYFEGEKND